MQSLLLIDVGGTTLNAYSITPLSHELISSCTSNPSRIDHQIQSIVDSCLQESTYDFVIVGLPGPVSQACQQPLFCPPLQTFVDISHLRSSGCVVVNDVTSQFLLLDVKPTHSNSILLTIGTSLGLSCIDSLFFSKPLHERVVYLMSATSFEIAHELLSNFELPSLQLLDYFSDISRTPSLATIFSWSPKTSY